MSLGFSGESDPWNWDHDDNGSSGGGDGSQQGGGATTDANNCWIQQPQNYNYQQYTKQQESIQHHHQNNRNQSGIDYFETVDLNQQNQNQKQNQGPNQNYIYQDLWSQNARSVGHQGGGPAQPVQPPPRFTYDKLNYNPSSAEVENREVAPPPDKLPKNTPLNYNKPIQNAFESKQNYQGQQQVGPPPASGHLQHLTKSHHHHSNFNPQVTSSPLAPPPVVPPPPIHHNTPPPPVAELQPSSFNAPTGDNQNAIFHQQFHHPPPGHHQQYPVAQQTRFTPTPPKQSRASPGLAHTNSTSHQPQQYQNSVNAPDHAQYQPQSVFPQPLPTQPVPPHSALPQSAPPQPAPLQSAPPQSAPPQSAPPQPAPPQSAPPQSAPPQSAPPQSAPPQSVPSLSDPDQNSSGYSRPSSFPPSDSSAAPPLSSSTSQAVPSMAPPVQHYPPTPYHNYPNNTQTPPISLQYQNPPPPLQYQNSQSSLQYQNVPHGNSQSPPPPASSTGQYHDSGNSQAPAQQAPVQYQTPQYQNYPSGAQTPPTAANYHNPPGNSQSPPSSVQAQTAAGSQPPTQYSVPLDNSQAVAPTPFQYQPPPPNSQSPPPAPTPYPNAAHFHNVPNPPSSHHYSQVPAFPPPSAAYNMSSPPQYQQRPPTYSVPEAENVSAFNQNLMPREVQRSSSPAVATKNANVLENQERILPENREHLDNAEVLHQQMGSLSINQQRVESVILQHCSVDRNQYLETGQLSNLNNTAAGSANIEMADEGEAPPPGLYRLVTGQGCENQEQILDNQMPSFPTPQTNVQHDSTRHSTPLSSIGEPEHQMRCVNSETDGERSEGQHQHNWRKGGSGDGVNGGGGVGGGGGGGSNGAGGAAVARSGELARLVPGQSIGEDSAADSGGGGVGGGGGGGGVREVPGEASEPRVVLGQHVGQRLDQTNSAPPVQDNTSARSDTGRERERDRESDSRTERMVVGEPRSKQSQNTSTAPDDYRQPHRSRHRHRRESSFEEEERDYSTDREKRHEEYRRRDERHRRRREHRSPEYRSDEEYEERRGYSRRGDRRTYEREYSPEYYRRHRRQADHYSRDYDDYIYRENRSRPSSRTGSDYRLSKMEYQRQPRHFYQDTPLPPPGGHYRDFNSMSQRSWKEYCENMRRTDPISYTIWYNHYMSRCSGQQYTSDRASVHSGQSSTNQRHQHNLTSSAHEAAETIEQVDDTLTNEDFTPRLYSTAHIRGNFDGQGRLIIVDAHYPIDGQRPTVKICKINHVNWDPDMIEFLESPGPFIPGITHRNTVLQYLKRMSDRANGNSEKLLYDLVHLTVKGNGVVNGSDVAELLMDSYKYSVEDKADSVSDSSVQPISETAVISRFRELLQQGNKMEALEWAMEHNAWGHALFLAYKMDDRTHNNVMLRFANSLPHNDPLQTLYQLMSGHVPQASTYCAEKNWSDWRPHLAMILSNPTANIALDRKAIITLGDSLGARGRIFAAHFCYLTAQVEFSIYKPDSKLVLLGSSASQEFSKFATCRAIMLSLCYEYGLKLYHSQNSIPTFQFYKLLLASRLVDNDRHQTALQYCELLAKEMIEWGNGSCGMTLGGGAAGGPPPGIGHYDQSIAREVIDVATRLKAFDPVIALSGDTNNDPDWLAALRQLNDQLALRKEEDEPTSLTHGVSNSTLSEVGQDNANDVQYQMNQDPMSVTIPPSYINTGLPIGYEMPQNVYIGGGQTQVGPPEVLTVSDDQQQLQHQQQQQQQQVQVPSALYQPPYQQPQQPPQLQTQHSKEYNGYHANDLPRIESSGGGTAGEKPWENGNIANLETQQPMLEPPLPAPPIAQPTAKPGYSYYKALDDQLKPVGKQEEAVRNKEASEQKKGAKKKSDDRPTQQNSGWFGGIWEKLSMRPKNQMRLPDDKNPTIVWDNEKKRWVNLDGEDEDKAEVKPPPTVTELAQSSAMSQQNNHSGANPQMMPPPTTVNKYKLQKGSLKSRFVASGAGRGAADSQGMDGLLPKPINPLMNTNLFVPAPVEGTENAPIDFITPGNNVTGHSLTSNRTDSHKEVKPQEQIGMMYNPAGFTT